MLKQTQKSIVAIRKRLPVGRKLPRLFDQFASAKLPVKIQSARLKHYELDVDAEQHLVPFVALGDGGILAFWFHSPSVPVVFLGGEGEKRVIAIDFEQFVKAASQRKTGLWYLDEADPPVELSSFTGRVRKAGLASLQKQFDAYCQQHSTLVTADESTPGREDLRRRVYATAQQMIKDGRHWVFDSLSDWWSLDFKVERSKELVTVTYRYKMDWKPVPKKYGMIRLVQELLQHVSSQRKKKFDLEVHCIGSVSLNDGTDLLLEEPDG
jgi:hypothetical protein